MTTRNNEVSTALALLTLWQVQHLLVWRETTCGLMRLEFALLNFYRWLGGPLLTPNAIKAAFPLQPTSEACYSIYKDIRGYERIQEDTQSFTIFLQHASLSDSFCRHEKKSVFN